MFMKIVEYETAETTRKKSESNSFYCFRSAPGFSVPLPGQSSFGRKNVT